MQRRSFSIVACAISLLIAVAGLGRIAAADDAKNAAAKTSGTGSGLITDFKPDSITIQIDGDDAPTKFDYGPGVTQKALTTAHIFPVNRINFKWKLNGDNKEIDALQKVPGKQSGVVIGTVIKVYNDFWVSVKPINGNMIEGFALGGNSAAGSKDILKSLNPGDTVGIRYITDFERQRIQQIQVKPGSTN
jgi:hypothetical protein